MSRKTLLFYLKMYLLFSVCIVLCFLPVLHHAASEYRKQELQIASQYLRDGADSIDSLFHDLMMVTTSLSSDASFYLLSSHKSELPLKSTVTLKNYQDSFSMLALVFPQFSDFGVITAQGLILTRNRCFVSGSPYPEYLSYEGLSPDDWEAMLGISAGLRIHPAGRIWSYDFGFYSGLTVTYTTSGSSPLRFYGTLPVQVLTDMLTPGDLYENCGLNIRDAAGEVLLDLVPGESVTNIEYSSSMTGLQYTVMLPVSAVSRKIQGFVMTFVYVYIAVSLLSFLLAFVFSVLTHKPVRKIVRSISPSAVPASGASGDDFTLLQNTVEGLSASVSTLESQLAEHLQAIRSRYFESARSKSWLLRNEEAFLSYFPDFPAEYKLLMIEPIPESDRLLPFGTQVALISALHRLLSPSIYCTTFGDYVALLLPVRDPHGRQWDEKSILRTIKENTQNYVCAVSNVMSDILALPDAYTQCLSILMHVDRNEEKIWSLADFPSMQLDVAFSYEDMDNLHALALKGDYPNVQRLINDYYQGLYKETKTNYYSVEQFFNNLRSILLKLKIENYPLLKAVYIPDYSSSSHSSHTLNGFLYCFDEVCSILSEHSRSVRSDFPLQVIRYIDEKIGDASLCVQSIASHFGISSSSLQKTIRGCTGKSCAEYIEEKRMQHAKDLISNSDRKISEIVADCGYTNPNTFFKAFKRVTSMTPSEWRKVSGNGGARGDE